VKWVYQMTPHDAWDYDGVNENVLFDKGSQKLLAHFDRNGFGYTLDRTTGKLVTAKPYGPTNWAKSIDMTTGRPVGGSHQAHDRQGQHRGNLPGLPLASRISSRRRTRRRLVCSTFRPITSAWTTRASR